jgi:nicotinic acid phosphoribosyltransferase
MSGLCTDLYELRMAASDLRRGMVPEGRVVFAGEPPLAVTAPIAQAQPVETARLNVLPLGSPR